LTLITHYTLHVGIEAVGQLSYKFLSISLSLSLSLSLSHTHTHTLIHPHTRNSFLRCENLLQILPLRSPSSPAITVSQSLVTWSSSVRCVWPMAPLPSVPVLQGSREGATHVHTFVPVSRIFHGPVCVFQLTRSLHYSFCSLQTCPSHTMYKLHNIRRMT
jgi:hypothetical protein